MTRDDVIEAMAKAHTSCGCEFYGKPNHEMWDAWPESGREEARDQMRAALSALESLGIALVPVEPTRAMCKNGLHATMFPEQTWGMMLSASPLRKTEGA